MSPQHSARSDVRVDSSVGMAKASSYAAVNTDCSPPQVTANA